MTIPSITGSIIQIQNSGTSPSQSVSIPADAELCLFTSAYWIAGGGVLSSASLDGNAFTSVVAAASDSAENATIWRYIVPAGLRGTSKTLAWTWASVLNEGANIFIVFLKDVDTSGDPIRDSDQASAAGSGTSTTPAINTDLNDLMICVVASYSTTDANAGLSGQTEVADSTEFNSDQGAVGTKNGVSGTTTMSGSGLDRAICAASVKGSITVDQPFVETPEIDETYDATFANLIEGWVMWLMPDDVFLVEQFWSEMPDIDETYLEEHFYDGLQSAPLSDEEPAIAEGEFPFIDEHYSEEQDYAGIAVWQTPEDIVDFQALAEMPQVDEQYDEAFAHDFSGFAVWIAPDDVQDALLGVVELPEVDERYSLVEEFFGWQTVVIEETIVEEPLAFTEFPQMDERYEYYYEYFGWQHPSMIDSIALHPGARIFGKKQDQLDGVKTRQLTGKKTRNL